MPGGSYPSKHSVFASRNNPKTYKDSGEPPKHVTTQWQVAVLPLDFFCVYMYLIPIDSSPVSRDTIPEDCICPIYPLIWFHCLESDDIVFKRGLAFLGRVSLLVVKLENFALHERFSD